jgi:hypothetical protein
VEAEWLVETIKRQLAPVHDDEVGNGRSHAETQSR